MAITHDLIILVASDLADEQGLNHVSLKNVALKLNIKTPSLYNHISSLDELLHEVAHKGMKDMNTAMSHSAIGKAGDDAIKAVAKAYLNYVVQHPGIYETIQWICWHRTNETEELLQEFQALLTTLIVSCHFSSEHHTAIRNLIFSFLHGYITMNLGSALIDYTTTEQSLCEALDTILTGLHTKYND